MNNSEKQKDVSPWWRDGLISFIKVSASISIPIIIALYLGNYLDDKYNTKPWIFLGLTFIAFIISLLFIYINMMKYIKEIESKSKNK